jgi:FixJ family two-component response regulator
MTERQDVILVADSDEAVRAALKFLLEAEGFTVRLCEGSIELLTHPELHQAQCLVLDDQMPTMNGVPILERLIERSVRLPIILITSHATDSLCRRAIRAGVRHILEKPLLNGALIDSLYEVLDHRTPLPH